MDEINRKGELIRKYILSLVYEDEIPDVVNQAINDLVQAAQQGVQADGAYVPDASDLALKDMIEKNGGAG